MTCRSDSHPLGGRGVDRLALVHRNNPVLTRPHPCNTLTVGNGDAAMTVDLTGLQTFPDYHELRPDPHRVPSNGAEGLPEQRQRAFDPDDFQIPLRTQSTWGWYTTRPVRQHSLQEAVTTYRTARGDVPYLDRMGLLRAGDPIPDEFEAGAWFAYNPRRLHLGRLALDAVDDRVRLDLRALTGARTELDLWTGTVHAAFDLDGAHVEVATVAHPSAHRFATKIESPALRDGLAVSWIFDVQPDDLASFEYTPRTSTMWSRADGHWSARREVESTTYWVEVDTTGTLTPTEDGSRIVATSVDGELEVVVTLTPDDPSLAEGADRLRPTFDATHRASSRWWEQFWTEGAAVDFQGSSDPRASQMERRVVLSQYLTVVNSAGCTPPAETGLTYNTWTGKFHLEMHWWHAAHFSLWGRGHLLERSLDWYHRALGSARATAEGQGYRGARWPKQTDPSARESPSHIGVFLLWQQPHIINLLELLYQEGRGTDFLAKHYPLVEATADFMADFAEYRDGEYVLAPPLIPAQESYLADYLTNTDPTFELAYWAWGLGIASEWRRRLDLPARDDWEHVARHLRKPTVLPGDRYAAISTSPYLVRHDHPSMLMALGWLPPTASIDEGIMARTLDDVWANWDLQTSWGWDYAVMSMTATALGDLDRAVEALLLPAAKNQFLPNGHNPQMPGFLSLYLPANGAMLAAIEHLVAAVGKGATLPAGWCMAAEGFRCLQRTHEEAARVGRGAPAWHTARE